MEPAAIFQSVILAKFSPSFVPASAISFSQPFAFTSDTGQEMDKSSLFLLTWSFLSLSLSRSNSCLFAHSSSMSSITIAGEPVVFTTTPFPLLLTIILTPEQDHRVRGAIVTLTHRRRVSSPACSHIPSWSPDHSHCRYSASPHHSQRNRSSSSEQSPPHRRQEGLVQG